MFRLGVQGGDLIVGTGVGGWAGGWGGTEECRQGRGGGTEECRQGGGGGRRNVGRGVGGRGGTEEGEQGGGGGQSRTHPPTPNLSAFTRHDPGCPDLPQCIHE